MVRLLHACSKATLPSVAFAPGRARRAGQPYNEATWSFPTGYPPNLGGLSHPSPPQCGSSPPVQPFPCPAGSGSAGAGSAPLLAAPFTSAIFTCLFYDFNF